LAVTAYRYLVSGRVQGVGYRYYALRAAEALGVSGYARNLPDGRVEVVAEASQESLAQLEDKLRQGPSFASVHSLEKCELGSRGSTGFSIR
jgi:acylphosphatase